MAETNTLGTKQPKDSNASAAASSALQAGGDAAREGAEAMKQSSRATGDAIKHSSEVGAEAARHGSEAGADALKRAGDAAGETLRRGTQAVAAGQHELVQDATERFQDTSLKIAQAIQSNTENIRTLMMLPNSARGGIQELQQSVSGLVQGVIETNVRATQELFRLTNPGAIIELQQRFMSEYLVVLMEGSAALVRATRQAADQTLPSLEAQLQRRRDRRDQLRNATS
jgi:hypothetical protein